MEDKCVCWGSVVPEGSQVCPNCLTAVHKNEPDPYSKVTVKTRKNTVKVVLDEGAVMPRRAHKSDAGYDLFSREDAVIHPNSGGKFDTGVHMAIPEGSEGVIDSGYTGSIHVKLFNHGTKSVRIEKGQKISQLVLLPIITPELELVDSLEETERGTGGFGSTGKF